MAQNCGPKIHRELASRSFTDALLRLASDRVRENYWCLVTLKILTIWFLEYSPASQVEDLGAHARMDGDVRQQPGFWDYGTSLHDFEDAE